MATDKNSRLEELLNEMSLLADERRKLLAELMRNEFQLQEVQAEAFAVLAEDDEE